MNITEVAFGDQDKLLAAVEQLKRGLPAMMEYQLYVAKIIRARHQALLAEGFTEAQATEIVKEMYK